MKMITCTAVACGDRINLVIDKGEKGKDDEVFF